MVSTPITILNTIQLRRRRADAQSATGNKFYTALHVNGVAAKLGDFVKVRLEDDADDAPREGGAKRGRWAAAIAIYRCRHRCRRLTLSYVWRCWAQR